MPFDVMYTDKSTELKRMVLDYIKNIRRDYFSNLQANEDVESNGFKKNTLDINEAGFPLAPRPHSWTMVKRADLEGLYKLYITRSYRTFYQY